VRLLNDGQIHERRMGGFPQQLNRWRGVENRRIEVARVGKCDRDAHLAALRELPGGGAQVEDQFKGLAGRDRLQLALQVVTPGEAEIVERSLWDQARHQQCQATSNKQDGPVQAEPHIQKEYERQHR
jgi:hypothetical protein